MLSLSPKVDHSSKQSSAKPFIYTEISTGVLDDLISKEDHWKLTGQGGKTLDENLTVIIKDSTQGSNPKAHIENQYGPPTTSVDGFLLDDGTPTVDFRGIPEDWMMYQSFRLSLGHEDFYDIPSVVLKLKKIPSTRTDSIACLIWELPDDETFVLGSRRSDAVLLNTGSIGTSYAEYTFTFNSPFRCFHDRPYIVLLVTNEIYGDLDKVAWAGWDNEGNKLRPREHAGHVFYRLPNLSVHPKEGRELFLKVKTDGYSDDAGDTYRSVRHNLGSVPTNAGTFEALYDTAGDSILTFEGWASNAGTFTGEEESLGTLNDGDKITNLKQYYKIKGTFSSPSKRFTARWRESNVIFPSIVNRFSSHPSSSLEVVPAIKSVSVLKTGIDLKSYITKTPKMAIELVNISNSVSKMAQERHLKNSLVEIKIGFKDDDIDSIDTLIPYFTGKIVDYSYEDGILKISIQDHIKDLSIRLPREKESTSGPPPAIDFSEDKPHIIDALERILFEEVLIQARYKDSSSFSSLKTALGTNWITDRAIAEPTDARELVTELLQVIRSFMFVGEDGVIKLVQYPRSGSSIVTWDDKDVLPGTVQLESFDSSIINRAIVLYDYRDFDDRYHGIVSDTDGDAQSELALGAQLFVADRLIKTKWIGGDRTNGAHLAKDLSQKIVAHASRGIIKITCETTLKHLNIQVGDFVDLKTRVFLKKGVNGTVSNAEKMIVLSKTIDVMKGIIRWDLAEAQDKNEAPIAAFDTDVDNGVPNFTVSVISNTSTDPDGTIADPAGYEWDWDYDGVNFQPSGDTGQLPTHQYTAADIGIQIIALRVTDNDGAIGIATKRIYVLGNPTPIITTRFITDSGQPLSAVLDGGGSYASSGVFLVKYEWDFTYDGFTFNVDAEGQIATINLPHDTTDVALRITDQFGLTSIGTFTLIGKTVEPADVQNFRISQAGDKIILTWDAVADIDLYGYEIRFKYEPTETQTGTWTDSLLLKTEELTTSTTDVIPSNYDPSKKFAYFTFLIKAIDSTGNYSINATSIFIKILTPEDRNVVIRHNAKALGWPGTPTDLIFDSGGQGWWIEGSAPVTLGALPPSTLGGLPSEQLAFLGAPAKPTGNYETVVIDLGAVLSPTRVISEAKTSSLPNDTNTSVSVEYRISDDNIIYTPYAPITVGDLSFRYIQFKITLNQTDDLSNIFLDNFIATLDVPDISEHGEDVDVQVGGTTIVFKKEFQSVPSITHAIQNLDKPHFVKVINKSKTGFTMQVLRMLDNVDVGSQGTYLVDWRVRGY